MIEIERKGYWLKHDRYGADGYGQHKVRMSLEEVRDMLVEYGWVAPLVAMKRAQSSHVPVRTQHHFFEWVSGD